MRLNRIYTPASLEPEQETRLAEKQAHYLHRVLRLGSGDSIVLFNGDGWDYAATISSIGKDGAVIGITARLPAVAEPELRLCLVQAVSRGERMDTTLQKATELGISEIQPLLSERVEVKLSAGRVEKRMLHWRGVIASACEQSGRATLPVLRHPVALSDWLAGEKPLQGRVLHPGADSSLLDDLAADQPITLIVGPEGGFSDTEIRVMTVAGIRPVHFGRRILRTETAGPAAIAALQFQLGDLG